MDSREIEISLRGRIGSIVHFWGVYTSDKLPYVQYNSKPIIFIANTLHSNTPVTTVGHWVCFYIEFHPLKQLIFYDSYGLLPDFYSADFSFYINKKYKDFKAYHFGVQLQPDMSQKCGLYTLNFIHYVSHYGINQFINLFKKVFKPRKLNQNDGYVTRYYFKYLSKFKSCSYWKRGKKRAVSYAECKKIYGKSKNMYICIISINNYK